MKRQPAMLVLADGTVFRGEAAGFEPPSGIATGEVVFNTAMSGYQEVLTDPSYAGQVIAFTYPHIGNYGVTPLDEESAGSVCRGMVVRELEEHPSSWRSVGSLEATSKRTASPRSPVSTHADSRGTSARRARSAVPSAPRPKPRSGARRPRRRPPTDVIS